MKRFFLPAILSTRPFRAPYFARAACVASFTAYVAAACGSTTSSPEMNTAGGANVAGGSGGAAGNNGGGRAGSAIGGQGGSSAGMTQAGAAGAAGTSAGTCTPLPNDGYQDCSHALGAPACDITAVPDDGFCKVEGRGCVLVGSPPCEPGRASSGEGQAWFFMNHWVAFAQHEVTIGDWKAEGLLDPNAADTSACHDDACPVVNVTWYEALAFANRVSMSSGYAPMYALAGCQGTLGSGMTCTGASYADNPKRQDNKQGFRLPTEIEWEYAARGEVATSYYTGEISASSAAPACADDDALAAAGWYCSNSGGKAHAVGAKTENPWGLYDMLGNVAEWVANGYDPKGYGPSPLADAFSAPLGTNTERVIRGGSFDDAPAACRAAARAHAEPNTRRHNRGFRLVRTAPTVQFD